MPNRWLAVVIGAFWVLMMALLVERDVLPHWKLRQQPDFRDVARAAENAEPVRWKILRDDESIGTAETEWVRKPDGWSEFRSKLDLKELPISSTLLPTSGSGGLRWQSAFHVSPDGDLHHFDIQVYWGDAKPTMTVQGRLEKDLMRVFFRSGEFSHEEQFYYEPHSLLMTTFAPIDKLPNLSVGQTWQHRVMNPILRTSETVRCEVTREQVITWRQDLMPTYVVEQHYGQMMARCWVAHDGTVLRQEVPLGWNPLVLEHE